MKPNESDTAVLDIILFLDLNADMYYNFSIDDMVAGLPADPRITEENFPFCRVKPDCYMEQGFYLVGLGAQPQAPTVFESTLSTLEEERFIPEGLPGLAALRSCVDKIGAQGIRRISAVNRHSLWHTLIDDYPQTFAPYLQICEHYRPDASSGRFGLRMVDSALYQGDFFVCRRF